MVVTKIGRASVERARVCGACAGRARAVGTRWARGGHAVGRTPAVTVLVTERNLTY